MDPLDLLDFDAISETAFPDIKEEGPCHLKVIADLGKASAQSDLPAALEAFTTLRYTNASPSILARPGNALWAAVDRKDQKIVAYLLSEGVRVEAEDVRAATLLRATPILRMLLDHGWPINRKLGWYDPPAMAYATEDLELTKWFLSRKADPNARCGIDKTPLSIAVQKGPLAVIEALFAHGGSIKHGQLLHWAASRQRDNRIAVVKFILQKGAAVNAIMYEDDEDSFIQRRPFGLGTPLHDAAAVGDLEVVRLLLDHGADVGVRDTCGRLPFEIAGENGNYSVAELLRPLGD